MVKDAFVYGIGDVLLRGTAFFTVPIYTRLLTPVDYGRWSLVLSVVGLFGGFLALGGDSAYARFFFEAQEREERRLITSTWLAFLTVWSIGVTAVVIPFSVYYSRWSLHSGSYGSLYVLALITAPVTLLSTMLGQVLRNEFRARLFTALNVISTLLTIGLGVAGAFLAARPLVGILAGGLIGTAVVLPARIWFARAMFGWVFSPRLLRQLLRFGIPLVPVGLAWWIFGTSDRIVLGKLGTLNDVGLYSVAISISSFLALFVGALGMAWSPHAYHVYETRRDEAPAFYGRVATYIVVGFGGLSVLITAYARDALLVLSTRPFYGAAIAVGPLALGFVAYATTQITASGLSLMKKTSWFAIVSWAAAVLNLVLNLVFVPYWGMLASAWATFAAYLFLTMAYLAVGQRLWRVAYETRKLAGAAALTIAFTVGVPLLPEPRLALDVPMRAAYVLAFVAAVLALRIIDQRELSIVRSLVVRRPAARPREA